MGDEKAAHGCTKEAQDAGTRNHFPRAIDGTKAERARREGLSQAHAAHHGHTFRCSSFSRSLRIVSFAVARENLGHVAEQHSGTVAELATKLTRKLWNSD